MHTFLGFRKRRKKFYLDGLSDRNVDPTQRAKPLVNAVTSQRPESPPEQHFPTPPKSVQSVKSVVTISAFLPAVVLR
jgi:hypothetical protein